MLPGKATVGGDRRKPVRDRPHSAGRPKGTRGERVRHKTEERRHEAHEGPVRQSAHDGAAHAARLRVLFGQRRVMVLVTLTILVLAAVRAVAASSASFTATFGQPRQRLHGRQAAHASTHLKRRTSSEAGPHGPAAHPTGTLSVGNDGTVSAVLADEGQGQPLGYWPASTTCCADHRGQRQPVSPSTTVSERYPAAAPATRSPSSTVHRRRTRTRAPSRSPGRCASGDQRHSRQRPDASSRTYAFDWNAVSD